MCHSGWPSPAIFCVCVLRLAGFDAAFEALALCFAVSLFVGGCPSSWVSVLTRSMRSVCLSMILDVQLDLLYFGGKLESHTSTTSESSVHNKLNDGMVHTTLDISSKPA